MAEFNPQVQPVEGTNYLGWSKAIGPVQGNKATEVGLKGAGQIGEEAVKFEDFWKEKEAYNTSYQSGKQEHDQYIADLEATKDYLQGNRNPRLVMDANTDLLGTSQNQKPIPTSIQNFPRFAQSAVQFRDSGKGSETEYAMHVDQRLQQLRSQFPGYRNYVDSAMERATGVEPANFLARSLIKDIDALNAKKEEGVKQHLAYWESQTKEQGLPHGITLDQWMAIRSGVQANDPKAIKQLYNVTMPALTNKFQYEQTKREVEAMEATEKGIHELRESAFSNRAMGISTTGLSNLMFVGADKKEIGNALKILGSGEVRDSADWVRMSSQLQSGWLRTQSEILAEAAKDPMLRGEKVKEFLAAAKEPWDTALKAVNAHDGPLATFATNLGNAVRSQKYADMMTGKYGSVYGAIDAAKQVAGEVGVAAAITAAQRDVPGFMQDAFGIGSIKILSGDTDKKGNPYTASTWVDDLQDQAKKAGYDSQEAYRAAFNFVGRIVSPEANDGEKAQIAKAFFGPGNDDLLAKVKRDYVTPDGKEMPGRFSYYAGLTDPKFAKEMKRLGEFDVGKSTSINKMYIDRMEGTFLNTFLPDVKQLDYIQRLPGVQLSWDTEHHKWNVDLPTGADPRTYFEEGLGAASAYTDYKKAKEIVDHLNTGIEGLVNIYEVNGKNPDEIDTKILKGFISQGYDINKSSKGVPAALIDTIRIGRQQAEEAKKQSEELFNPNKKKKE